MARKAPRSLRRAARPAVRFVGVEVGTEACPGATRVSPGTCPTGDGQPCLTKPGARQSPERGRARSAVPCGPGPSPSGWLRLWTQRCSSGRYAWAHQLSAAPMTTAERECAKEQGERVPVCVCPSILQPAAGHWKAQHCCCSSWGFRNKFCPGQCGSLVGAPAHTPKGHPWVPGSISCPRQSVCGGYRSASLSHGDVSLSRSSPSLPSSLPENQCENTRARMQSNNQRKGSRGPSLR